MKTPNSKKNKKKQTNKNDAYAIDLATLTFGETCYLAEELKKNNQPRLRS